MGTGRPTTIRRVAELLAEGLGVEIRPEINQKFRAGDIRHCYADISRARKELGYEPRVQFEDGVSELIDWVRSQQPEDRVEQAHGELVKRGLAR